MIKKYFKYSKCRIQDNYNYNLYSSSCRFASAPLPIHVFTHSSSTYNHIYVFSVAFTIGTYISCHNIIYFDTC